MDDIRKTATTKTETTRAMTPEANIRVLKQLALINRRRQKKALRKVLLILAMTIVAALASWQGYEYYQDYKISSQIPVSIRNQADFPVYLPAELPGDYTVDVTSSGFSQGVFFYDIKSSDKKTINITVQSAPEGFDSKKAIEQQKTFDPNQKIITINTRIGVAYNLSRLESSRYMVATNDNLLIFITSNQKIQDGTIQTIINGLKLVK